MDKNLYKKIRTQLDFKFRPIKFIEQMVIDLVFLYAVIYLLQTPVRWLAFFPVALFMFRHFSILHEAVHGLAHPSSRVNFWIGIVSGSFCLTPYLFWKIAHMKHHYWTGNLEQDPTFAILKSHKQFSERKRQFLNFCWQNKIPLLGFLQHIGFWSYFLKDVKAHPKSVDRWIGLAVPVLIWGTIFWQAKPSGSLIITAGIILYLYIAENMIVPQHVGLYSDDDPEMRLHPWEQIEITRTWHLPYLFEKFVVLNMNYHTEHHMFPDLPWHQLANAHEMILQSEKTIPLTIAGSDWMSEHRQQEFVDVIRPVAIKRRNEAA